MQVDIDIVKVIKMQNIVIESIELDTTKLQDFYNKNHYGDKEITSSEWQDFLKFVYAIQRKLDSLPKLKYEEIEEGKNNDRA